MPSPSRPREQHGTDMSKPAPNNLNRCRIVVPVSLDKQIGNRLVCELARDQTLVMRQAFSSETMQPSSDAATKVAFDCIATTLKTLGLEVLNTWKATTHIQAMTELLCGTAEPPEVTLIYMPFDCVVSRSDAASQKLAKLKEEGGIILVLVILTNKTNFMPILNQARNNMYVNAQEISKQTAIMGQNMIGLNESFREIRKLCDNLLAACIQDPWSEDTTPPTMQTSSLGQSAESIRISSVTSSPVSVCPSPCSSSSTPASLAAGGASLAQGQACAIPTVTEAARGTPADTGRRETLAAAPSSHCFPVPVCIANSPSLQIPHQAGPLSHGETTANVPTSAASGRSPRQAQSPEGGGSTGRHGASFSNSRSEAAGRRRSGTDKASQRTPVSPVATAMPDGRVRHKSADGVPAVSPSCAPVPGDGLLIEPLEEPFPFPSSLSAETGNSTVAGDNSCKESGRIKQPSSRLTPPRHQQFQCILAPRDSVWVPYEDEWFVKGQISRVRMVNGKEEVSVRCEPVGGSRGEFEICGTDLTIAMETQGPLQRIVPNMPVVGPYNGCQMYSGAIFERPCQYNNFRCLVMFDDGAVGYVKEADLHPIVRRPESFWESRPEHHRTLNSLCSDITRGQGILVDFEAGQQFRTEWNSYLLLSKVERTDGSLVLISYTDHPSFKQRGNRALRRLSQYEWIYRGNARLAPVLEAKNQLKQKLLRRDPSVSFRFYVHALRYSAKLCDFSGPRALSALSLDSSASGAFSETVADSRRKKKANGKEQGMRRKNEKGKAAGRTDQSKKTGRGRKKKSCDAVDPASEAYTPEVFQPVQIGSRSGSGDDKATTSQPQSAEQDLSRESLRGLESNPCPRNVSSRTSRPNSPAPTASVFHRLPSAPATVGGLPVVHVQSPSATESDGSLGHQQAHQDFIAEDSSESDPSYMVSDPDSYQYESPGSGSDKQRSDTASSAAPRRHPIHTAGDDGRTSPASAFRPVSKSGRRPTSLPFGMRQVPNPLEPGVSHKKDAASKILEVLGRRTPTTSFGDGMLAQPDVAASDQDGSMPSLQRSLSTGSSASSGFDYGGVLCPVQPITIDYSRVVSDSPEPAFTLPASSPRQSESDYHLPRESRAPLLPRPGQDATIEARACDPRHGRRTSESQLALHACGASCCCCNKVNKKLYYGSSVLSRPLLIGWKRFKRLYRLDGGKSCYEVHYQAPAPCLRRLRSMVEVERYLQLTRTSNATVDQFCFNPQVRLCPSSTWVSRKTILTTDISNGTEKVPILCVMKRNAVKPPPGPPKFNYSPKVTYQSVWPHDDKGFLVCCDCTDGCLDKEKCACQQLTKESAGINRSRDTYGYTTRRILNHSVGAIYECNSRCSCSVTCANRVVQLGIQVRLAVFYTGPEKGWGLHTLDDIPQGAFVCTYVGKLLTSEEGDLAGKEYGDEYLAELDHIELCEHEKKGFELDAYDPDADLDDASCASAADSAVLSSHATEPIDDELSDDLPMIELPSPEDSGDEKSSVLAPRPCDASQGDEPNVPQQGVLTELPASDLEDEGNTSDGVRPVVVTSSSDNDDGVCIAYGTTNDADNNDAPRPRVPTDRQRSSTPIQELVPVNQSSPHVRRRRPIIRPHSLLAVPRNTSPLNYPVMPWHKVSQNGEPLSKRRCIPSQMQRVRRATARASTGGNNLVFTGQAADPIVIRSDSDEPDPLPVLDTDLHSDVVNSSHIAGRKPGIAGGGAMIKSEGSQLVKSSREDVTDESSTPAALGSVALLRSNSLQSTSSTSLNQQTHGTDDEMVSALRKSFGDKRPIVLDAKDTGNVGRFINHSCESNLVVQNVFLDTHDMRFPTVAFFALCRIKAGQELTWTYGYEPGAVEGKQLDCHCGSEHCRGRLL